MNDSICVSCGEYSPDGSMLCYNCQINAMSPIDKLLEINIRINNISKILEFVKLVSKCPGRVYLIGDGYKVSAKSIMGVCSLNLSKPVKAVFFGDIPKDVLMNIEKFVVEEGAKK